MEILFCNVQVHHLQFTFSIERPTYRNAPNLNLNSNDTTDWRITLVNRENRRKNAVKLDLHGNDLMSCLYEIFISEWRGS